MTFEVFSFESEDIFPRFKAKGSHSIAIPAVVIVSFQRLVPVFFDGYLYSFSPLKAWASNIRYSSPIFSFPLKILEEQEEKRIRTSAKYNIFLMENIILNMRSVCLYEREKAYFYASSSYIASRNGTPIKAKPFFITTLIM